jgi:hypothetical protein
MVRHILLVAISVSMAPLCTAQAAALKNSHQAGKEPPKVTRMTLYPADEPKPALKYKLLPGFHDRRPDGNAAVVYNKIMMEVRADKSQQELIDKCEKWSTTPLDQLPKDGLELLVHFPWFDELDRAARMEICDWQQPLRESKNPIAIVLPEIQYSRDLCRILAARARFHIARGEYDKAIRTLQTGYALGRHVGRSPFLISGLIGMAICDRMSDQVETLIQQPDCPNLYWALTGLPRPIISLNRGYEAEAELLYLMFPALRQIDRNNRSSEYWSRVLDQLCDAGKSLLSLETPSNRVEYRTMFAGAAILGYPKAKRALIAQGVSREEVKAMPVAQVMVCYTIDTFNEFRDDTFKWLSLPYWQAHEGMQAADRRLAREGREREIIPIASLLLPAVAAAKTAETRVERRIALLRAIEALRMYAATHGGKLPKRLDDATATPPPIDPFTGKIIDCKISRDLAVLEVFHLGPDERSPADRRIEIRIRGKE